MLCDGTIHRKPIRHYKKTPTIQFLRRVECRTHKVRRHIPPATSGTVVVRYGTLHGLQDRRAMRCRYRGINHGDEVKSGVRCLCQTIALSPSPLHRDITRGLKRRLHIKMHS
ncbi:LAME_0F11584g1_1 [Lachancea meyersii CBS 8951]|uniref:LAME_0F11584g1_1 n=1 Tax=Lachancea meyersii CBS 8951 TaxID=1266667 RepID=A0A1G4JW45_9SACH|nr:LAME_0F11584g1_1 [Lachancea meyersii CBS 8951]